MRIKKKISIVIIRRFVLFSLFKTQRRYRDLYLLLLFKIRARKEKN